MIGRCLILLLISAKAYAQTYTGTRYQAMGSTGTALQEIYSLTVNPSGLTALERPTAHVGHQYHFLSTEITGQTALLGIPTRLGNFGLMVHRYGLQDIYNEIHIGFAYAKQFGRELSLAVRINAHQLGISNYGTTRTFSADMGLQYHTAQGLIIGLHYLNVGGIDYAHGLGALPSTVRLGASYRLDKVTVTSDVVYDRIRAANGHLGLEYAIITSLLLRGGVSVHPLQQHAGFGLVWGQMVVDVAATFQHYLGISPQIGISYAF